MNQGAKSCPCSIRLRLLHFYSVSVQYSSGHLFRQYRIPRREGRRKGLGACSFSFCHRMHFTASYLPSASLHQPQVRHFTMSFVLPSLTLTGQSGSQSKGLHRPIISALPCCKISSASSGVRIFPAATMGTSYPASRMNVRIPSAR